MILIANGGALFRGLLKKKFYNADTKVISLEAYLRREIENPDGTWIKKDSKGISVAVSREAVETGLVLKGTAQIESMAIRAIRFRDRNAFLADPPVADSPHGNIVDIPYRSEDKDAAEFLAGELARQSELL
jgi:hypothetical protein